MLITEHAIIIQFLYFFKNWKTTFMFVYTSIMGIWEHFNWLSHNASAVIVFCQYYWWKCLKQENQQPVLLSTPLQLIKILQPTQHREFTKAKSKLNVFLQSQSYKAVNWIDCVDAKLCVRNNACKPSKERHLATKPLYQSPRCLHYDR